MVVLTPSQKEVLSRIVTYISTPFNKDQHETYTMTLSGSAGTGKTTLTKEVIRAVRKTGKQVLAVAPTHKARRVLSSMINTSSFLRIPTTTVAGLLGKMRVHGYIGTHNYKKGMDSKIGMYDFFIIDEISMVTTDDYTEIVNLARSYEKKILFIGDHLQIPHPAQGFSVSVNGDTLVKDLNPAFTEPAQAQLTHIVRNTADNPLVDLLAQVRDLVGTGFSVRNICKDSHMINGKGYELVEERVDFLDRIREHAEEFRDGKTRVVSYTNNSVLQYNKLVRSWLGYMESVVIGEILTGYNNVGPNNDLIVENGQDYTITDIKETKNHCIVANGKTYDDLHGKVLTIEEYASTTEPCVQIFLLDLDEDSNFVLLEDLVELAMKVNRKGSTKTDYRNYITLKSQLVFMEDLYKYKGHIYTGTEFRQLHPLLYTKTADVLTGKHEIIESELMERITSTYPGIITARVADNKEISGGECLADQFKILEKDLSYGYGLTSHKSQGSTYHTVFVDETDFNALRDGWSTRHKIKIDRNTERDRLKYVALSRASTRCYIHVSLI